MRTVLATALGTLIVVALFHLQGIADGEQAPLETAVAPTQPDAWNAWGMAVIDQVELSLTPVACAGGDEGLCVEVKAHNPTDQLKHVQTNVNLMAERGNPMSRVTLPPELSQSRQLVLQIPAGGNSTQIVRFDTPESLGESGLSLAVGSPDEYAGGQPMAQFYNPELALLGEEEQRLAITF